MFQATLRHRPQVWFAAGVVTALIVTLVGLQAWRVGAADEKPTSLVPITPCRLIDTRPGDDRVGTTGSFGPEETETLTAVGDNGECTGIPDEATALSLNVTALNATDPTFLAVWPGGDLPNASSLNPSPGQPPVPNAVVTPIATDGTFKVFNKVGTVDVIIDVNGYYLPAGPTAFERVLLEVPLSFGSAGDTEGSTAQCPSGKNVIGGGSSISPDPDTGRYAIEIVSSVPNGSGLSGWSARALATENGAEGTMRIYAICAAGVALAP